MNGGKRIRKTMKQFKHTVPKTKISLRKTYKKK